MATGLLALLDDVVSILDDVAVLSKVAAQKTAGIAGDDLAVNAEGLIGIDPSRELPIIGKVALGSVANKFVLVPLALALPHAAITPLLMCGGAFLCYEGFHKVAHKHDAHDDAHHDELVAALKSGPEAVAAVEAQKVRQAIITDVVLSAEIVAVALGAMSEEPFATKAVALSVVSLGMTAGIYGLVAAIVKVDDVGFHLQTSPAGSFRHTAGGWLVRGAPVVLRGLSVVGTAAMFLVGGGILIHGIPAAAEAMHHLDHVVPHGPLFWLAEHGITALLGVVAGVVVAGVVAGVQRAIKAVRG